jgi:beta-galactosidase GanA
LTLSPPLRYNLPSEPTVTASTSTVIVKQQKKGWEGEFQQEIQAYEKLVSLQGTIIPIFFGQGSFNNHDALVISEVNGITLHDLANENLGVQHEALEKHLKSALSAFDDHGVYWDAKLDNFMFCAGVNPEQSKVMIVDLEQVECPRSLEPWLVNINSRSAPDLLSNFKYRQNPNRPTSPAGCYQPGAEDGGGGWESVGLQRTSTVDGEEASQVDTGSGVE